MSASPAAFVRPRAIGWRGALGRAVRSWGLHVGSRWRSHLLVAAIFGGAAAGLAWR